MTDAHKPSSEDETFYGVVSDPAGYTTSATDLDLPGHSFVSATRVSMSSIGVQVTREVRFVSLGSVN